MDDKSPEQQQGAVFEAVIGRLFEKKSAFRAFLRRKVGDDAIAEDLLQQSLVRAIERHHSLDEQESVVAWFYRILRNAVIDYYRSRASETRKNEAFLRELVAAGDDMVGPMADVYPTVCACMHKLLPAIRPAYADVIRRVDLQGESAQAVANDMNVSQNNLTVRLHRARQALRARLEQSCGVCSKHGCLNCTCSDG